MSEANLLQVIKSVLSAMIGVQSQKNREIDFQQGSVKNYVIVGAIAVILFVLLLVSIVALVL